jgi:serine/threonine protein kinase
MEVGPLTNGRYVKEDQESIIILYPLRDFLQPQQSDTNDIFLREVATLEALKLNIGGSFPSNFTLSKSVNSIAIQIDNPGMTLRSLIHKKAILVKHGLVLFKLLFEAIRSLNFRGYAHRDLSPENILISKDFQ